MFSAGVQPRFCQMGGTGHYYGHPNAKFIMFDTWVFVSFCDLCVISEILGGVIQPKLIAQKCQTLAKVI